MTALAPALDRLDWISADPTIRRTVASPPADYRAPPERFRRQHPLLSVEEMAAAEPNRAVVFDGTVSLTYAELLDRVYGLAARLQAETPAGAPVALLVRNTAAAPVAFLACAAAGRVVIPIDASHPLERQAALFADGHAAAVVVQEGVQIDDSFVPAEVPRLAFDPARPTGAPRFQVEAEPDPDGILGVVYTSGSTGTPKGLAFAHADALGSIVDHIQTLAVSRSDVIIGLASLSTGGPSDIFSALFTGALIRMVDIKALGLAEGLRILGEEGVTLLAFVPTVLRMVMSMDGVEQAFRSLRVLDLRGEAMLASDVPLFRSRLPATCEISVCLASTEAMFVFQWFVRDELVEGATVPVGYLLPGKQVALVGEDGQPAPHGEAGEALVRGRPMAAGAWRDGRVARGPFLPDPEDPAGRIYPLGDLLRFRPDGLAEFVGRRDRQVKIRGLWADLGEIEAALRSVPGVADAVVLARDVENEGLALAAFVAAAEGASLPSRAAIRRRVAAETAEHMVPGELRVLPEIPRLANYKPDLVRLEALVRATDAAPP